MTDRLHAAIDNVGGLSVAKPAAVLSEMKSGGEQGLPTRKQIDHKLQYLRPKEEESKQVAGPTPNQVAAWQGVQASILQTAAMAPGLPSASDQPDVTASARGTAAYHAASNYLNGGGNTEGARKAGLEAAARAAVAASEAARQRDAAAEASLAEARALAAQLGTSVTGEGDTGGGAEGLLHSMGLRLETIGSFGHHRTA